MTAALARKLHRAGSVQSSSRRDIGATEVHASRCAGTAAPFERRWAGKADDLVHIVTAAGLIRRSDDPELAMSRSNR